MGAPNTVQPSVIQEQPAPSQHKGSALGTLAGVALGVGTGNWAPLASSVLGSAAGGAVNQATQATTSTPQTSSPATSSAGQDDKTTAPKTDTTASDAAQAPLGTTPDTVHQQAAAQIGQALGNVNGAQIAQQLINPATGQLNPQALLAMMSSQGKQGPNATQVQQQSLMNPMAVQQAGMANPAQMQIPQQQTPAFGQQTPGQF